MQKKNELICFLFDFLVRNEHLSVEEQLILTIWTGGNVK